MVRHFIVVVLFVVGRSHYELDFCYEGEHAMFLLSFRLSAFRRAGDIHYEFIRAVFSFSRKREG